MIEVNLCQYRHTDAIAVFKTDSGSELARPVANNAQLYDPIYCPAPEEHAHTRNTSVFWPRRC